MSKKCRIFKGGLCETTQGYSHSHQANDLVGAGYTLDTVIAHSGGTINFFQDGYDNMQGSSGNASYGNCVKINHGNGYETLYAHMQKGLYVKNGQYVKKGQELGYMGNSGNSYGAHTHFEVRKDGVRIDPTEYVDKDLFTIIELPKPVETNDKVNQVEVVCGDTTLRCRTGHSTNDEIIGFIKEGYYNIVSTYEDGEYNWFEVEKDKWIAGVEGCIIYHPLKEPKIDDSKSKDDDNTNIPDEPKKDDSKEKKPNNNDIPNYYDKKDNPLLWLIDMIVAFIKKIFNYKR